MTDEANAMTALKVDQKSHPRVDVFFRVLALVTPLWLPGLLLAVGVGTLTDLPQSREVLRSLLSGTGEPRHVAFFFLAFTGWLFVCRNAAFRLLRRPGMTHGASRAVVVAAFWALRATNMTFVAVCAYASFHLLRYGHADVTWWSTAQVALLSASMSLACFRSADRQAKPAYIGQFAIDAALFASVVLSVGLAASASRYSDVSLSAATLTSRVLVFGWVVQPWISLSVAACGLLLLAHVVGRWPSRPAAWMRLLSACLVLLPALSIPTDRIHLLAVGLAGVLPVLLLTDAWSTGARLFSRWPGAARGGWAFVFPGAVGFTVFALSFAWWPVQTGQAIGSMATLFSGLAIWSTFAVALWWAVLERQRSLGIAAGLVALSLAFGSVDHSLRANLAKPGTQDSRPRLHDHYGSWKATLPSPDSSPVFVVAASGGGLRAAYWTALLLAELDDVTCGQFSRHVYAYSGVSGGSLGVAAFAALRVAPEDLATPCSAWRGPKMRHMLSQDFLASVAGNALFVEPLQRVLHVRVGDDRGSVLADAWSRAWDESVPYSTSLLSRPFLEVFDAKASAGRVAPAVFFNATHVETGRRAVATNVRIPLPGVEDLLIAPSLKRSTHLKTHGLTVVDAALNSARFTYVSPAGTTWGCFRSPKADSPEDECGEPGMQYRLWGRLVDGGYFENSGLATLTEVMHELGVGDRKLQAYIGNPVYYIVITNARESVAACPGRMTPRWNLREQAGRETAVAYEVITLLSRMIAAPSKPAQELPPLSELSAPVESLLSVREARANVEVARLQLGMGCHHMLEWTLFKGATSSQPLLRAEDPDPALGWYLSSESLAWMDVRAAAYAEHFPFDLAACDRPERQARGQIGDPSVRPLRCRDAEVGTKR